jgi:hypothetical protein
LQVGATVDSDSDYEDNETEEHAEDEGTNVSDLAIRVWIGEGGPGLGRSRASRMSHWWSGGGLVAHCYICFKYVMTTLYKLITSQLLFEN